MNNSPSSRKTDYLAFVRAARERAGAILARVEASGDAVAIQKWQRVIVSLEGEAIRAAAARLRDAA